MHKRPIIFKILLIVATPYLKECLLWTACHTQNDTRIHTHTHIYTPWLPTSLMSSELNTLGSHLCVVHNSLVTCSTIASSPAYVCYSVFNSELITTNAIPNCFFYFFWGSYLCLARNSLVTCCTMASSPAYVCPSVFNSELIKQMQSQCVFFFLGDHICVWRTTF